MNNLTKAKELIEEYKSKKAELDHWNSVDNKAFFRGKGCSCEKELKEARKGWDDSWNKALEHERDIRKVFMDCDLEKEIESSILIAENLMKENRSHRGWASEQSFIRHKFYAEKISRLIEIKEALKLYKEAGI